MTREFPSDTVQLATRIPKALHLRVRVTALDQGVTLAEWVGSALREHLDQCQPKKRPGKVTKAGTAGPDAAA
jgi:hypothetical protein